MGKTIHHFWGAGLVTLGFYELTALMSRGKLPTITKLCSKRSRRAAMLAWMTGAAIHITRSTAE